MGILSILESICNKAFSLSTSPSLSWLFCPTLTCNWRILYNSSPIWPFNILSFNSSSERTFFSFELLVEKLSTFSGIFSFFSSSTFSKAEVSIFLNISRQLFETFFSTDSGFKFLTSSDFLSSVNPIDSLFNFSCLPKLKQTWTILGGTIIPRVFPLELIYTKLFLPVAKASKGKNCVIFITSYDFSAKTLFWVIFSFDDISFLTVAIAPLSNLNAFPTRDFIFWLLTSSTVFSASAI